mgnify:FL=1
MDLLTILKLYLFLGCVAYLITIVSRIKRHLPKISIDKKKKREIKEDDKEKD